MVHTEYSSMPTGKASYSDETNAANVSPGTGRKGGDGIFYYLNEKTAIKVIIGDICDIMADAIVSIEDENGSGKASVAKAIFKVAGSRYIEFEHSKVKMAKKSITDIVVTGAGQLKCQFVLHAIAPEWSLEAKRENQTFRKNVTRTMLNIMDAAFEKKLKSFAVPLIGTSTDDKHKELLTTCSEAMIDGLHQWIKSHSQKYQFDTVMLICSNEVAFQCIADLLHAKLENKGIEKGRLKRETLSKPSDFQSKLDAYTTKLSDSGSKEDCVICMETITDPKVLPKCGHTFCKECIHQQFKYKPVCPCCGVVYGKITGVQPDGTMKIFYEKDSLPGFEKCGTIIIFYEFNGGTQKEEHPHPGRPYSGTKRIAYLPDNDRGRFVLKLLREAFKRRLVFTIGTSRTTGQDDTVIWNDIHHKTNRVGGPQNFGYPDAIYLDRVTEELAVKEVTEESLE